MEQNTNSLEQLKRVNYYLIQFSIVVADTGEINIIKKLNPKDSTTNPSLLLKSANQKEYENLIEESIKYGREKLGNSNNDELVSLVMDKLCVTFGKEIL